MALICREFCAHLAAMDEGIGDIATAAHTHFGDDFILIVSSDNGGSSNPNNPDNSPDDNLLMVAVVALITP